MNSPEFLQVVVYVGILVLLSPLLGLWIAKVLSGEIFQDFKILGKCESHLYKILGICAEEQMNWKSYTKALLWFNFFGGVVVFLLQICQRSLPLNPQQLSAPSWDLSFNTAVSFLTNTNWQAYSGESTLSYLTQMMGLGVQNFLSAATGIAVFSALTRGFLNRGVRGLGNFWVDISRITIGILLPMSVVLSVLLLHQGVIQNFDSYREVVTLEGRKQIIPGGPVASQVAIKQLGTNGGGYFNANSAHPFENPTPFSNFMEMIAILLIPAAIPFAFGRMIRSLKQGGMLFTVMAFLWLVGLGVLIFAEYSHKENLNISATMEGKETRLGPVNSVLWSSVTTAASNGSTNASLSSLSPIAGGISLFNILLGEIVFGGVGSGMYGLLLFVILTVFLSGLMVGRSPEFLGKKLESFEMKWTILGILSPSIVILIGMSIPLLIPTITSGISHEGPHGFTELLYAWASAAGNNGSAFGGFSGDTLFNNIGLGIAILIGRFAVIIPVLAIAGSLSIKKHIPESSGTFATDTPLFATLLVGVILVVGALTFLPALALGPIVEHFLMILGQAY